MPIGSMRFTIRAESAAVRDLSKKRRPRRAIFVDRPPRSVLRPGRLSALAPKGRAEAANENGCPVVPVRQGRTRLRARTRATGRGAVSSEIRENGRRGDLATEFGVIELMKAVCISRRQEQRKRLGPDLRRPRAARPRPKDSCDFPAAKRTAKFDIMSIISYVILFNARNDGHYEGKIRSHVADPGSPRAQEAGRGHSRRPAATADTDGRHGGASACQPNDAQ